MREGGNVPAFCSYHRCSTDTSFRKLCAGVRNRMKERFHLRRGRACEVGWAPSSQPSAAACTPALDVSRRQHPKLRLWQCVHHLLPERLQVPAGPAFAAARFENPGNNRWRVNHAPDIDVPKRRHILQTISPLPHAKCVQIVQVSHGSCIIRCEESSDRSAQRRASGTRHLSFRIQFESCTWVTCAS